MGWANEPGALVAVATVVGKRIVGYVVLGHPDRGYWANGDEHVLEVVFMEVARPYRRRHVLAEILQALEGDGRFDDDIVFARLLASAWDRSGNRLRTHAYRRMLLRLTRAHGFEPFATDDLRVALRPSNVALRRVGSRVPPDRIRAFRRLARHDPRRAAVRAGSPTQRLTEPA